LVDCTAFERDTLVAIAALTARNGRPPKGPAIVEVLEADYQEVNDGRLYPSLGDLVERGLIIKSARDHRTNEYALTGRGRRELRADARCRMAAVEGGDGP
jgi:DNA-binding PadR family transcriptional regulator